MTVLNIHFENTNPKDFPNGDNTIYLRQILETRRPVIISPSLYNQKQWKENGNSHDLIQLIRNIVTRKGSALGQQGHNHYCQNKHKFVDPWHEFACPWGPNPSIHQQRKAINKGRNELGDLFEKDPSVFVPPNHLFDSNTLDVVRELGYNFFTDKAMFGKFSPYLHRRFTEFDSTQKFMLIVPEYKLSLENLEAAEMVYTHYDQIRKNEGAFNTWITSATSTTHLIPSEKNKLKKKFINEILKVGGKYCRDVISIRKSYLENKNLNNKPRFHKYQQQI